VRAAGRMARMELRAGPGPGYEVLL
jgi:hypothetical protein